MSEVGEEFRVRRIEKSKWASKKIWREETNTNSSTCTTIQMYQWHNEVIVNVTICQTGTQYCIVHRTTYHAYARYDFRTSMREEHERKVPPIGPLMENIRSASFK